ncbi:hypothetical protein GJAV_G00122560 [Gymnothorax javanicus]|nr:hypothetical protein GJAV_G00122560 [Gymnothorax javanicus]
MSIKCTAHVCAVAVLSLVLCIYPTVSAREKRHKTELYVPVGTAVHLACQGEGKSVGQWKLNGMVLDTSDPSLSIQNVSLEDGGNYTCHSETGALLDTLFLQPGYLPTAPNVECWSPGYPITATCSWDKGPKPLLPTQYTATYGIGQHTAEGLSTGQTLQPCLPVSGLKHHCRMKIQLFHQEPHVIIVTATNPLGRASSLHSFMVEDVVKPDPPVHVSVTPQSNRRLLVQWDPPPTWMDLTNFPLKYYVRYYPGSTEAARELGPYETQKMVLKALRSRTTYFVQVSAQDQLVGQRSEWSQPVSATVL